MKSSSAQDWFAAGERIGYDPESRAIVAAADAPLGVFLRREGNTAHAVSFLPGFPGGSFGWAKVRPPLPPATAMGKPFGLQVERLPGGHLTATEQAGALAGLIARFEQRLSAPPS